MSGQRTSLTVVTTPPALKSGRCDSYAVGWRSPCRAETSLRVRVACIHGDVNERWICAEHLIEAGQGDDQWCRACLERDGHSCHAQVTPLDPA